MSYYGYDERDPLLDQDAGTPESAKTPRFYTFSADSTACWAAYLVLAALNGLVLLLELAGRNRLDLFLVILEGFLTSIMVVEVATHLLFTPSQAVGFFSWLSGHAYLWSWMGCIDLLISGACVFFYTLLVIEFLEAAEGHQETKLVAASNWLLSLRYSVMAVRLIYFGNRSFQMHPDSSVY